MSVCKCVGIWTEGCVLETNASISLGYDAARVFTSQTEEDLTARTDRKIIPWDEKKVN